MGLLSTINSIANTIESGAGLISSLRSLNVPGGLTGALSSASVLFSGDGNTNDWRVRLSVPDNPVFSQSGILSPLRSAGGLVFPFTPTISLSGSANYDDIGVTHQNYQMAAYRNSAVENIQISGDFISENAETAKYWIAALHFLRSATKMYTADSTYQGSPPPIVTLNGYGDYVFKNVPVVITNFSVELPNNVDYIATTVSDFSDSLSGITDLTSTVSNVADVFGFDGVSDLAQKAGTIAGTATDFAGKVTNIFGNGTGVTHVPIRSNINVTVKPVYSREATRQFSLQKFVNGEYVKGSNGGYI